MTKFIPLVFLLAVLVIGCPAWGAEPKDYSQGFEKFYKLGLTDVSRAEYIRFTLGAASFIPGNYGSFLGDYLQLSGNAWMVGTGGEDAARIAYKYRVIEVQDEDARREKALETIKKTSETGETDGGKTDSNEPDADIDDSFTSHLDGKWEKADLEADIEKIIDFFRQKESSPDNSDYWFDEEKGGEILLFAAFVYKKGHKDEANRIVDHLFKAVTAQRKIIIAALNILADAQYEGVYEKFQKKHDWKTYRDDLDALMQRFPQGWKKGFAVQRLLPLVKQRNSENGAPGITGEFITEADRELAQELAECKTIPYLMLSGDGLWVLQDMKIPKGAAETGEPNTIYKIMEKGMTSIPLLAALLKDEYLTGIDLMSVGAGGNSYFFSENDEMTEEAVDALFNGMRRPATRSDIAELLLTQILPVEEDSRRYGSAAPMDPDELLELATQFYNEHKNTSRKDLAVVYLNQGTREQQHSAFNVLLEMGKEDAGIRALLEKKLLEADDKNRVAAYVRHIGPDAKKFVETFIENSRKIIEKQAGEMEEAERKMAAMQMDSFFTSLRAIVDDEPAEEILAKLVAGKVGLREAWSALSQKFKKMEPDKAIGLVLKAAVETKKTALRAQLVELPRYIIRMHQEEAFSRNPESGQAPEPPEYDVKHHAALWKTLLADPSLVLSKMITLGELAAIYIEVLSGSPSDLEQLSMFESYGESGLKFIKSRAEQWLAGADKDSVVKWPSAETVSEERLAEITGAISEKEGESLKSFINGLSMEERLALLKQLGEEEETALYPKLVPIVNTVTGIRADLRSDAAAESVEELMGSVIARPSLEAMHTLCKTLAAGGSAVYCRFARDPLFNGIQLTVTEIDLEENPGIVRQTEKPMVVGRIKSRGEGMNAQWLIAPSPKTGSSPDADRTDDLEDIESFGSRYLEEAQNGFWKMVEGIGGEGENSAQMLTVFFLGTPGTE